MQQLWPQTVGSSCAAHADTLSQVSPQRVRRAEHGPSLPAAAKRRKTPISRPQQQQHQLQLQLQQPALPVQAASQAGTSCDDVMHFPGEPPQPSAAAGMPQSPSLPSSRSKRNNH